MKKLLTVFIVLSSIFLFNCYKADTQDEVINSVGGDTTYSQRVEKNVFVDEQPEVINSTFGFDDLVTLSKQAHPDGELNTKLENHLSMAFVLNRPNDYKLEKNFLRVAQWNVKRGFNADVIRGILMNPKGYEDKYLSNVGRFHKKNFKGELRDLADADIICLNEVDIGMPRTGYKNIVSYIADPLNLNYVYATEFVEVGPIFLMSALDKEQYKGLHGNVILSKFPIVSSEVIRLPNRYDWYMEEIKKHDPPLEHFRRFGAKLVFSQPIESHEVRHGSRNAIIADIKLPNDEIVTIVLTHLEDRAYPDERLGQFKYLLEKIKDKKTPVILTGDFNTSTTDTKPTCMKKEVYKRVRDPHFLVRAVGSAFVPGLPFVSGFGAVGVSKLLQYKDPFYPSIPVVFPNHERKLYTYLKKYKFDDGYSFDLRGEKDKSSNGKAGLLANSNQRHWKGFKSTYKLEEPRIIAYFKLDWFFVKPLGDKYAPFNGRTLKSLNRSFPDGISDHNPITVDIKI